MLIRIREPYDQLPGLFGTTRTVLGHRDIGARMPGGLVRAIAPAALSFIMEGEGSDAMASVKTSKVNPKYKRKYRVRNWAAYERGLRDRGDVTVWLSQEAIEAWTPPPTGRRGGCAVLNRMLKLGRPESYAIAA
jgi:hypothetical protein